jgi:hypothetical protein
MDQEKAEEPVRGPKTAKWTKGTPRDGTVMLAAMAKATIMTQGIPKDSIVWTVCNDCECALYITRRG